MIFPRTLRLLFFTSLLSLAAAAPATAPSASPPQTGEITLKFTQRGTLSAPSEIARRISLKQSDLEPGDYDLTTFPFRAYVPSNYDPQTSYGVFVYLGNHDRNQVPPSWEPLFDKSHMIYITPDWHTPQPEWQLVALGFDAIDNLKHFYNIDPHRLYGMWFNSGSLQMALAGADVYTGIIVGEDWNYFRRITIPGKGYCDATIPMPPSDLLRAARPHGVVLISVAPADPVTDAHMISMAVKQDGFENVLSIVQAYDQVHYPYVATWITDPVLPFLDKAARQAARAPIAAAATTRPAGTAAKTAGAPSASAASADAQHLLTMAKLFIDNGNTAGVGAGVRCLRSQCCPVVCFTSRKMPSPASL